MAPRMLPRWASVNVPALPLQLLLQRHPAWRDEPVAMVAEDRPQGAIAWVNGRARRAGLVPEMRYATGLSLAPCLRAGVLSPAEITASVEMLSARLHDWTPRVEPSGSEPGLFWLVGKHWEFFLHRWKKQGFYVEYKKKRAYFQLVEGDRNTIRYDSRLRKGVRRDVVKQRGEGKYIEYENEGICYSVVEFGGTWAIQLKPFYMFTKSDGHTPLPSFVRTRRATRRMKFDRNKSVDDDLTFWARLLSAGQPIINIGSVGVENLILDSEYCSVEVPLRSTEGTRHENAA
jgi:hypothetical protein